jgi:hypothetical protein
MIIVVSTSWLVVVGCSEWERTVAGSPVSSCDFHPPDDTGEHSRLIDLNILDQELREPVFDGTYVVNLGKTAGRDQFPLKLTMTSVSRFNYGINDYMATLHWDDGNNLLWMVPEKIWFLTMSASHYLFPFDSATFDETLWFEPPSILEAYILQIALQASIFHGKRAK